MLGASSLVFSEPAERGAGGGAVPEERGAGGGLRMDDRGAGGGGDPLLAIIQAGKGRANLRSESDSKLSASDFKNTFCEKAAIGLNEIQTLSDEQSRLAHIKLKEVCVDKGEKIRIAENLMLANGDVVSAMNWPKYSIVALDVKRIIAILNTFNEETRDLLLEVLFAHEILSLIELESTGNYRFSLSLLTDIKVGEKKIGGLQDQYDLERVVGIQALLFEMNRSAININQYQEGQKYSGIFLANDFNFIREQLLSFSPLFDDVIRPTLSANYLLRFNDRVRNRGKIYFAPINDYLLQPVLQQFKNAFAKQNIVVDFSKSKSSWALAFQLHQLYLAIGENQSSLRKERFEKMKFVIMPRRFSLGIIPFNGGKIQQDDNIVEITFNESLTSGLENLKKSFSFVIEKKFEGAMVYRQWWQELHLEGDKYRVHARDARFGYQMQNQSYHESYEYDPNENRVGFKSDVGLMTKDRIQEFLKTELRD